MLNPEDKFNARGTKEKPYTNFGEAMKAGEEGNNVWVGDTFTKMEYAPSQPSSSSSDSSSSGIKDVQPSFLEQVFGVKNPDGSIWTSPDDDSSFNLGTLAKGAITMMNPAMGIPMMLSGGISNLLRDTDGDGSMWTSTAEDGTVTNILGQKLNMDKDRKVGGFFDSFDVDGDGSMFTTGGKFFTPQTPGEQEAYLKKARESSDGGGQGQPTPEVFDDANQNGWMPDGTPRCKPGYVYDASQNMCVPPEEMKAQATNPVATANPSAQPIGNPYEYGFGGEQMLTPSTIKAKHGLALHPTGIVRGRGGPKDDLVGPIALSAGEMVMPVEQIQEFDPMGERNYQRGIAALDNHRINSLKKYG